ncbi:MAG: hypothetical protein M3004_12215 [Bacteroidota bacterium]|nr:hypothetical protein [Bacteroidota bacterium]
MKHIYKAVVLFTLLLSFNTSKAQVVTDRRPSLFAAFSNTINFPATELEKIFTASEGKPIKLSLGENVGFTGTIVSSVQKYENLQSVVVRLDNLDNTIFGVSKRINDDKSISYIGRMINTKYGDAFELKTDTNGNYFINKTRTEKLIEDHD